MPDLSAQQLHELMSPIWERCPELRPSRLRWDVLDCQYFFNNAPKYLDTVHATQLCESQMVRWLAERRNYPDIHFDEDGAAWHIGICDTAETVRSFTGLCLVQALASACTAVLDAKDEEPA